MEKKFMFGFRTRTYVEQMPRFRVGKNYRKIQSLIESKEKIRMIIYPSKKSFFFQLYDKFPIPEDGVMVQSIPCRYGGLRYYCVCPYCRRRFRNLFLTQGEKHPRLVCRKCLRLSYRTQSEDECNRLITKYVKLLHKYGFKDEHIKRKDRPEGMHKKTFRIIKKKIQEVAYDVNDLPFRQELIEFRALPKKDQSKNSNKYFF